MSLAACSSSTGGSGTTTGTSEASSAAKPSQSSGSAAPTAPSTGGASSPSSSAAPHTVPPGKYARSVVHARFGDPVLVDWCAALGTDFTKSTRLTGEAGGLQFTSGCGLELKSGSTTEISLEIAVEDPSIEKQAHPPVTGSKAVGDATVETFALTNGICPRLVKAGPVDAIVEAIKGSVSATSPLLCQAADLGVQRFVQVDDKTDLPRLTVPSPSYSDVDLCKVAQATSTVPIPKFGTAQFHESSFGTNCSVEATNYIYTLQVERVPDVLAFALYKTTKAGTHTLQADSDNTHLKCDLDDIGPKIAGTPNSHEVLDITLNAHYGSAQLCGQVADFMGKLLDTAGIK